MSEELNQPLVKLCIVGLMGLPGSGKSTFCGELPNIVKKIPNSGLVVVRYDNFVPLELQSTFPETQGLAKSARKQYVNAIRAIGTAILGGEVTEMLVDETMESAEKTFPIKNLVDRTLGELAAVRETETVENIFLVADDNNYYQSMRNELYQVAKQLRVSFCVLYLDCPLDLAVERNNCRPDDAKVPQSVLEEMSKKLEEPDSLSNPCDLFCIRIDAAAKVSEEVKSSFVTLLGYALQNSVIPVEPKDNSEDRRVCSENEVHQADLVLRKWVSKQYTISSVTSHTSTTARKQLSERLSHVKAAVLQKLRNGDCLISYNVDQDVEFHKEIVSLADEVEKTLE